MSQFLEPALKAIKLAEAIILKASPTVTFRDKADLTPVTAADIAAEKAIRDYLRQSFPQHGFLGEENKASRTNADFVWIIDPIDGTKNYTRHLPMFATQLALMHQGEIVLGISNAPALKELLVAEKGSGAYLNDQRVKVSTVTQLDKAYISHGGIKYFEKISKQKQLERLIDMSWNSRSFGDFWAYHFLAQGKIDVVCEARVKIWDIAALSLIIQEAGGMVSDLEGQPIDINTHSFLAANPNLHSQILKILNQS